MTDIENYLFDIYKDNPKMKRKIYYHKNKKKLLEYNNKKYADRFNNMNHVKINKGSFLINLK